MSSIRQGLAAHEAGHAVVAARLGLRLAPTAVALASECGWCFVEGPGGDAATWLVRAWDRLEDGQADADTVAHMGWALELCRCNLLTILAGDLAAERLVPDSGVHGHADAHDIDELIAATTPRHECRAERLALARASAASLVERNLGLIAALTQHAAVHGKVTAWEVGEITGLPVRVIDR